MKQIIEFLRKLKENNNREWFHANKGEYQECKWRFDDFATELIEGIRSFDDSIGPLTVGDCTWRIYRDTRFSADKTPYKTHMGVYVAKGGKKSGFSGYYFQVGPEAAGYDAGCMLAAGNYYCESPVLKMLREDISFDDGKMFGAALDKAATCGFSLDMTESLKRMPAGFPDNMPYSQWLKLRNFCLEKTPDKRYIGSSRLVDKLVGDFRSTKDFLDFINWAIEFNAAKNQ